MVSTQYRRAPSHCHVYLCTAADGAAFFDNIAQTPPRAPLASAKDAAAGPASPPPLPKEVPVIDGPAGEGEAEIQKLLFVGNYGSAVDACLEVSGAGLPSWLHTRAAAPSCSRAMEWAAARLTSSWSMPDPHTCCCLLPMIAGQAACRRHGDCVCGWRGAVGQGPQSLHDRPPPPLHAPPALRAQRRLGRWG